MRRAPETSDRSRDAIPRAGESGTNGGFIIVAVLWIVAAVATLVTVYSIYARTSAADFLNHGERVQAEQLAIAGIELAVYRMVASPRARKSSGTMRLGLGGGQVGVRFRPENARVDLNAASKELIAGLFAALGAEPEDAANYADRVAAWRSAPESGADPEGLLYKAAGKAYAPRHGPFQHVGELALVLGLPPALIDRALPFVTVYSGVAEVNVRDAAPQVLAALPGLTPEGLHVLLAERETAPQDVLRARLGLAARDATVDASRASRVTVDVRFGGQRRYRIEAVVLPTESESAPFRILSWRDDSDALTFDRPETHFE